MCGRSLVCTQGQQCPPTGPRESLTGDTQLWLGVLTTVSGLRPLAVHVGNTDVPFLLLDPTV